MSRAGLLTASVVLALVAACMAALLAVLLMSHNNPASAQSTTAVPGTTITVNTEEDESNTDGDCSLREAITAANTNTAVDGCAAGSARERDAILFSLGQEATIVLGSKLPTITDTSGLTINGGRQAKIVVSGDGKVQVFSARKDAKLALKNLTVADGFADTNGPNSGIGGGIENRGGTLTVTRSTFSGNNAVSLGGGIANINGGTLKVINSTFSGNRSGTAGGGVLNDGELKVSYSTFSGNAAEFVGGGINNANDKAATVRLRNTVLANSTNGNINNVCAGGQCRGTITDGGYNISDDSSFRFTDRTSKTDTDPKLDPNGLQNNGGPTETIALLEGSPAINAIPEGTNGCGTTIKTDQRGVSRPQGTMCDTGAFEKVLQR
jgi:CSLREA domain-containing protein